MKAIEKFMEHEKTEIIKVYCPFGFPWLKQGILEKHPDPETCDGDQCKECWEMEWKE